MQRFWDILQWTVVAAIIVAVVSNAQPVAAGLGTLAGWWTKETAVIATAGRYTPPA